ncbi:MAG TPA: anthranilate synthase component I family protein [Candidatus Thermoplasmatota archaeon]|nr:anthranilate synthase component I family protein [Candidatus Thermoplasmatota archaeon]
MGRIKQVPVPIFLSPHQLFRRMRRRHPNCFLLESRAGPKRMARYSILGFRPKEFFRDTNGADPLDVCKGVVNGAKGRRTNGFAGGLVGAIAYDAIHHYDAPTHPMRPPHYLLGLYRDAIVYNHLQGSVAYVTQDEDRSPEVFAAAEEPDPAPAPLDVGRIHSPTSQERFVEMVKETKKRIRDGETYQTVLSRKFEATYKGDLDLLYEQLRLRNPSPYMYHLDFGDTAIIGSSPEMLVRVEGRDVETFPIAGTRPKGATPREDENLKRELERDPKERAEHLMLVDLARNDVGRVSDFGSVAVPDFMTVESYSSVHHLVSRVTGRLRRDRTSLDAFRSLFPAGTVTGAPKIRAMQIIDELEAAPRGFYAGAVGYFGQNGDLETAITIRTLVAQQDKLTVQAGAGIVQDSDPVKEFEETQHKADAVLRFLGGPK